jgi:hypothetical protein
MMIVLTIPVSKNRSTLNIPVPKPHIICMGKENKSPTEENISPTGENISPTQYNPSTQPQHPLRNIQPITSTQPQYPLRNIQPTTSDYVIRNHIDNAPKKRGRKVGSYGLKRRREMAGK